MADLSNKERADNAWAAALAVRDRLRCANSVTVLALADAVVLIASVSPEPERVMEIIIGQLTQAMGVFTEDANNKAKEFS